MAYGLAIGLSAIATILRALAFVANQAAHNGSPSTFISITRNALLEPLFPEYRQGVLPLPEQTMRAQFRIRPIRGGWSLIPEEGHRTRSVCENCAARVDRTGERDNSEQGLEARATSA